jgi:hypothetical protein
MFSVTAIPVYISGRDIERGNFDGDEGVSSRAERGGSDFYTSFGACVCTVFSPAITSPADNFEG